MSVETSSFFAQVIQDHLELKRRNAALEREMPISQYMAEDPFDNHPLFKSEEQARIEDTMTGQESIEDVPTPLAWPTEESFAPEPAAEAEAEGEGKGKGESEPDPESEEGLWSRSRDFDWGD
jgi:hypothetical protein